MAEKIVKTKLPPTLIIGLGGTGCDIVSRVDKLSNKEQRKYIRFVYFDTDANELRVRKDESPYIFTVQTSRQMTVGQALRSDKEARENSFPTSYQLLKKPLTEGAGQVRAVSKLAFDACLREGRITPLHDAISELQHLNGDTLEQSMRVVIVSTLVGGTGSGILLPVSMYLRNYLENICQKKPIIRGICVLPDVFFRCSNKTEVEKNNLRTNAYAALRELDAFMLKADSSNKGSMYDKFWLKMPTPGTVDEYDNYTSNPMDFCFLYDGLNMDGNGLDNFEAYKKHVSDCVYASSVSMLNKRLNSSEDNTILARCEENGRNRYCGIGSSKIIYPFEHVRDYIAMNWMQQAITDDWLKYDKAYEAEERKRQISRQRGSKSQKPLDRRQYYCTLVDSDRSEKNNFAMSIFNQCHMQDPDGIDYTESKWVHYYKNILKNIADRVDGDNYDEGAYNEINKKLTAIGVAKSKLSDDTFRQAFTQLVAALKKYFSKTRKRAEIVADIVAESLFSPSNFDIENSSHIEYWLTDEKSMIHPNAIRYFLYNLEEMLKESKRRLTSTGNVQSLVPDASGNYVHRLSFTSLEESIRSFFEAKNYNKESTKGGEPEAVTLEEYAKSLDVKTFFDEGKQDKGTWRAALENIETECTAQRDNIKKYYETYLELKVIEKALEFIDKLSSHYEDLYRQLEDEINRLPRRIAKIEETFVNDNGAPVIYACASETCLKGLLARCPNLVDPITLTDEFREELFMSIYKTLDIDNAEKQKAVIKQLATANMFDFWRREVVNLYGPEVDMDVIDAMRTQAELEEHKFDADEQLYYIRDKKEEAMKLASPFIDRPVGIEPYIIEACSLAKEISESNDVQKISLIKKVFSGHEVDELMDKYQMLFMKALYNIRVSDLPKFAPEDDSEVDPRDNGSYYRSYWKRINGVIPDDKRTKILTPHLDKRWHYLGVMPHLAEKTEEKCLTEAHRALFISIVCDRIRYDRDQYRFIGNDGDFISDNIIVGDGRCNKFSEIYEAMRMSRPLVLNLLEYYKEQVAKEKSMSATGMYDYTQTMLFKEMENIQLGPYSHKLSFMEIPVLYKATSGSCINGDNEAIVMLRHMIEFVEEYLSEFYCDPLDRTRYFVQWMQNQAELLCSNLKNNYGKIMPNPLKDPLVKRIKEVLKAKVRECELNCASDDCVEKCLEALEKGFSVSDSTTVG